MSNEDLGVERSALRKLAVENLTRLRPKIEMHSHGNMLAMFDVGGTYEASLLLFDSIWTDGQVKVNGDIVVAVPTGDVLLVTGSKNRKGLSVHARARGQVRRGAQPSDQRQAVCVPRRPVQEVRPQVALCSALARSPTLTQPGLRAGLCPF